MANPSIQAAYLRGKNRAEDRGLSLAAALAARGGQVAAPGLGSARVPQVSAPVPAAAPPAAPGSAPVEPAGMYPSERLAAARGPDPVTDENMVKAALKQATVLLAKGDMEGAFKAHKQVTEAKEKKYVEDWHNAIRKYAGSGNQDLSGFGELINAHQERFGFQVEGTKFDPKTGRYSMQIRELGELDLPGDDDIKSVTNPDGTVSLSNAKASRPAAAKPTKEVSFKSIDELQTALQDMYDPANAFKNYMARLEKRQDHAHALAKERVKDGGGGAKDLLNARDKVKGELRAQLGIGTTQFDKLDDREKARQQKIYDIASGYIDSQENVDLVLQGKVTDLIRKATGEASRAAKLDSLGAKGGGGSTYTGPKLW